MTDTIEVPVPDIDLSILPTEAWPFFSENEIQAVTDVLRSGKINQWTGDRVFAFQSAYDEYLGHGRKSIALSNGSVALEIALRAWGVGPGDEVIVPPRTFVATGSCVRLVGATPVFADVDRNSGNITVESIEQVLTERTRAIIVVHLAGWPCDMPAIMELARDRGIKVLEDCAQAHGARIDGVPVGVFGDAAAFSFCQDKILTTGGEGGLTAFASETDFAWAWSFKDHGKNQSKVETPSTGRQFRFLHDSVGTNWRMLESSAALGSIQLSELSRTQADRAERARVWTDALSTVDGLRVCTPPAHIDHAWYKWYAYVDADGISLDEAERRRNEILDRVADAGIRGFSGSGSEIYNEGAFADLDTPLLPNAHELGRTSIMFEVHPTIELERLKARASVVASIALDVL